MSDFRPAEPAGKHAPDASAGRDTEALDPPTALIPQPFADPNAAHSSSRSSRPVRRWKVAAESVRGTSHEKVGGVCQDSHFVLTPEDEILIAAVADGAGSASHSELGSEIAARTAVEALQRWCALALPWPADEAWADILRGALEEARAAVESEAAAKALSPRDLASTLIVLLATPNCVVAAQIGDGAAVIADRAGSLSALTVPQSGEYLNETTFLVSPRAVEEAQTAVWRGQAGFLAAFSDGLQMLALKMSDNSPHAPFFAPLFRFLEDQEDRDEAQRQLRAFLKSPRITQRADDDLTLLLAQWAD